MFQSFAPLFRRPHTGPAIGWNADDPEGCPQEIDQNWQDQAGDPPPRRVFTPRLVAPSADRTSDPLTAGRSEDPDPYYIRQAERLLARAGITPWNFQILDR